jgi:hypothetical protein
MESQRSRAARVEPLRVTSVNPRRDARLLGHEIATSRAVLDARDAALRQRFATLLTDGTSGALAAEQRDERLSAVLVQVAWAYDGIADDLTTLETVSDGVERRDQILRETVDELTAMAELSTGRSFASSTWHEALIALRGHIEQLVSEGKDDTGVLLAIDLGLERIEYIEKVATAALRSYLGYISA